MQGADRPSDRALLVALNAAPGLPRAALCRLGLAVEHWRGGVPADAQQALADRFSIPLDSIRLALAVIAQAPRALAAEELAAERLGARIVTRLESDYPGRLADLALPPPVLEISGARAPLLEEAGADEKPPAEPLAAVGSRAAGPPTVAIVGSRKATPYGLEVASWLARELAEEGVVVVSGFARGIDAAAHLGALAADHGRTVGVLGCGLSIDYPKGHRELGERIRRRGALVSEFPCAQKPTPGNFPVRNRIIAALAEITVVVEAAAHSGSLITARLALDLGREVLAVPGRITDEQALGTNDLLRDGAGPVTHPADILERLGLGVGGPRRAAATSAAERAASPRNPPDLPPVQAALYAALDPARDLGVDVLARRAEIGIEIAVAALLEMELAGWAIRVAGGGYRRGTP